MKGKIKKLVALALATIMVLAMGITASAATITIENPQDAAGSEGTPATYEAFKIFSLVKSDDGKNYSYTLESDSKVYATLKDLIGTSESYEGNGITLKKTTVEGTYNATVENPPLFAAYLKGLGLTGGTSGELKGSGDDQVYEINVGNDLGYYFISTNSGTLADLTTVDDQLFIYDKNEKPQISKEANDVSVEVGQKVEYKITGTVPSTVGYSTYKYIIKDTMTDGLDFDISTLKNDLDSTVSATKVGNGFELEFDMTKYEAGKTFEVTYSATVNEHAINVDKETNSATLEYSNNPQNPNEIDTTPPEEVEVYTASVIINKFIGDPENDTLTDGVRLAGAEFVLSKESNGTTLYYVYTAPVAANPDEGIEEVSAKVDWTKDIDNATHVTTDDNGVAQFDGLEDGTYQLIETEAPKGYNLLTAPVTVTVEGNAATATTPASKEDTKAPVANYTGSLLPSTGGIGTTIFYVVGGVLVVAAGVLLITKKRMSKNN